MHQVLVIQTRTKGYCQYLHATNNYVAVKRRKGISIPLLIAVSSARPYLLQEEGFSLICSPLNVYSTWHVVGALQMFVKT